jgi:hypothetical protein
MKTLPGRVQNGVVVVDNGQVLPEGLEVTVLVQLPTDDRAAQPKQRIEVPLVKTGQPGTLALTGERIAEILDEEDRSPRNPSSGAG